MVCDILLKSIGRDIVLIHQILIGDKTAALEAVAALASSDNTSEESTTGKQSLYRVFKLLVQNGFFNNKEKKLECELSKHHTL